MFKRTRVKLVVAASLAVAMLVSPVGQALAVGPRRF